MKGIICGAFWGSWICRRRSGIERLQQIRDLMGAVVRLLVAYTVDNNDCDLLW